MVREYESGGLDIRRSRWAAAVAIGGFAGAVGSTSWSLALEDRKGETASVVLPEARGGDDRSIESLLSRRRSVREFAKGELARADLAQLLWAAQGITSKDGRRTSPSAGALYPLEVYIVATAVEALEAGIYRYDPRAHAVIRHRDGRYGAELSKAALDQSSVLEARAVIVFSGVFERTAAKYGSRAERYVWMEAGHAAQNVLLQAVGLGLGAVPVGAFDDAAVRRVLSLPAAERPLYLLPVGEPADGP